MTFDSAAPPPRPAGVGVPSLGGGGEGKSKSHDPAQRASSGPRDVVQAVEALGFGASVVDVGGDALSGVKRLQEVRWVSHLCVSLCASLCMCLCVHLCAFCTHVLSCLYLCLSFSVIGR